MQKSELHEGQAVAIYPTAPVPNDPAARHLRDNVRFGEVTNLDLHGVVAVRYDGTADEEYVSSRQIVFTKEGWDRHLIERDNASASQTARQNSRIEAEAKALAKARDLYPTARLENHCVVIPIDDWNAIS